MNFKDWCKGLGGELEGENICRVNLVNLTPHEINIYNDKNEKVLSIPSSGVARAKQTRELIGYLELNGVKVPINISSYGEPEGLPEKSRGTLYLVSPILLSSSARSDLVGVDTGPGSSVRDENGRILGVKNLLLYKR